MQKQFVKHLSVIVVGLGSVLYVAQNCGEDHRNLRTGGSESSASDEAQSDLDQAPMDERELSIAIDGEEGSESATTGLNLLAVPAVASFKATLLCGTEVPVTISSSPVLVSASADCRVGLTELSFGGIEGTYTNVGGLLIAELATGAKHVFQNSKSEQLIVQVIRQFSVQDKLASAAFRFFQVRRDKATVSGAIKEFVVDGQLAPDFRLSSATIGTSNAGVILRANFTCNSNFVVSGSAFTCGDFSSQDLRLVYEPIVKTIDFDSIENESPGTVDGPSGLISGLSMASKPLSSYAIVLTTSGFSTSLILGDTNNGRFGGVPEQVLLGVGTAQGGVATTVTNIQIQ